MEFGEWLRHQHQINKLDVRTFAEISRVDPSTISRIENLHTQATLYTAYRICQGLNISLPQLYYELVGVAFKNPERNSSDGDTTLTQDDVDILLSDYALDNKDVYYYFSKSFNELLSIMSKKDAYETEHLGINSQFTAENMKMFLSKSRHPVFRFDITYPQMITSDVILFNYLEHGVLVLDDVGAYIRGLRRSARETLRGLEDSTKISKSVLSRIEEGSLERIKLIDILKLDESLKQYGTLLNMCWYVCEFEDWINRSLYPRINSYDPDTQAQLVTGLMPFSAVMRSERQLISIYIRMCRWFQYVSRGADYKWPKYRSPKGRGTMTFSI